MKAISILYGITCVVLLAGCQSNKKVDTVTEIVNTWRGKEILFPEDMVFTLQGTDTVPYSVADKPYKILCYTDSIGCTSCKLKINEWKTFIAYLDSMLPGETGFLFIFHPRRIKDVTAELYAARFPLPVCIDPEDKINRLNSFPSDFAYQTFLLDKENKVAAIGNPVNNSAVRELYLDILLKRSPVQKIRTEIELSAAHIDMGKIGEEETGTGTLTIRNTGKQPFVVTAIDTSCGCLTTQYAKTPVPAGGETTVRLAYKPKGKGVFKENIIVRGNIPEPIRIGIKGEVV